MIELHNISKTYQNGLGGNVRRVLNDISLTIHSGDSVAITGPSGSGKSTLLNIAGTLDKPDSGKVVYHGIDLSTLKEQDIAIIRNQRIGFVFQVHYLLSQLNLLENVLVPVIPEKDKVKRNKARSRAMDLLQHVGLADKSCQFPGNLSVGECQRAALVRALVNNPEILLADEPTGSLDHDSATMLGELLVDLNHSFSVSVILVTHSVELAATMKKIYTLTNGKLTQHATI
jgi:ABC-type lipoprotein export system ATPase subunit